MRTDRATVLAAVGGAVWLLALTAVDILSSTATFGYLFAVVPLAVCALLPTLPTAVFGLVVVTLAALSPLWNQGGSTNQQLVLLAEVVLVSAGAVLIAEIRVRREKRFARVAQVAEVAQRVILPILPRTAAGVSVAARYESAAGDTLVGGDLFDCYLAPTHTRLIVGDVRGKGLAAVEQAARVIRAFRQSAAIEPELHQVARTMSEYLAAFFDDEEFATALLVDITEPDRLTLTSCGHPPAVLLPNGGPIRFIDAPVGIPLGLGQDFSCVTVPWRRGDRLLMYTDGVSEARNERGDFLPLLEVAPKLRQGRIEEALAALLGEVSKHVAHGLPDDVAVVLLENSGIARHERPMRELYVHPPAVTAGT
jgi:phosphoserine phosphatase RsbU/P